MIPRCDGDVVSDDDERTLRTPQLCCAIFNLNKKTQQAKTHSKLVLFDVRVCIGLSLHRNWKIISIEAANKKQTPSDRKNCCSSVARDIKLRKSICAIVSSHKMWRKEKYG